jgi:dolichol-phosphate mannosyltransferase
MLSVLLPTYNEKENIGQLIQKLETVLKTGYEIIVIDDNSPDGTAEAVRKLAKEKKALRLVVRKGKHGLTGAILAGVKEARGDRMLVMDADLSHPAEAVPELVSALDGCDIVIGSRLIPGGGVERWPIHRKLISRSAQFLAELLLNPKCSDPLSGFFAIRKGLIKKTRFRTRGYKLLLNILYDNPEAKVCEVPYFFRDREAGKTKLGMGEIGNYLLDIFKIRFG